jgi:uncharacterized protein (TIGR02246 family)
MNNESVIKHRVENWIKAIGEKDWDGILAWHHPDIVMYDVPPPFQSAGIEAYRDTWVQFLPLLENGAHAFRVVEWHVFAGDDVAFCHSKMKCVYTDKRQGRIELDFRLTIGFKKIDGEWWFMHEHHSVPADEN